MTTLALALAAVSTLVSLICFAAMVEMFKSLAELQKYVEYNDVPKVLPDAMSSLIGRSPSQYGLPRHLDGETSVVLLLSPRCHTCARVAAELSKALPPGLTIVLTGANETVALEWLQGLGLSSDDVILDHDYRIVNGMALYTTPAALRILEGTIAGAWAIPSYRALRSILDEGPPTLAPMSSIALKEHGGKVYATG